MSKPSDIKHFSMFAAMVSAPGIITRDYVDSITLIYWRKLQEISAKKMEKGKKTQKKRQKKSSNKMETLLGKIPCKTKHPEYQNSIKIEIFILRPDSASPRRSVQFALVIVQLSHLFAM